MALAAAAVMTASPAQAQNLQDWQAMGGNGAIQSGAMFTLRNVTDKEALKYGSRTWGINLVWDKNMNLNNVKFEKQAGSGDVKYTEPIAINVKGGGYLKYEKRSVGINLGWSSTPVYEWKVAGGAENAPVRFGEMFALYNERGADAVIYGNRPAGINLIWLKDYGKGWLRRAYDAAKGPGKDWLKKKFGL